MNRFIKRGLPFVLVSNLLLLNLCNIPVAADVSTEISGNVQTSTIDVSASGTASYVINGKTLTSDSIGILNNSNFPISIGVSKVEKTVGTLEDVLPQTVGNQEAWFNLGKNDSNSKIALGLKHTTGDYLEEITSGTLYFKQVQDSPDSISLGAIESKGSVNYEIDGFHGLAFNTDISEQYKITWDISLYDSSNLSQTTDYEETSMFNYEILTDSTQTASIANTLSDTLTDLFGVHTVQAASIEDEVVGTAKIVSVNSNFDKTNLIIPAYYVKDGKTYKVVEIGSGCFSGNEADNLNYEKVKDISNVIFPEGLETIGWGAFASLPYLSSITIPESVIYIDAYAFCGCSSMKNINIKSSDINFNAYCFHSIDDGATINVQTPEILKELTSYYYINGTTKIINVNSGKNIINQWIAGDNVQATFYSLDSEYYLDFVGTGDTYNYEDTPSYVINELNNYKNIHVTFSEGITRIGNNILKGASIYELYLPSSVENIGNYAFYCCNIKNVIFKEGLKNIGEKAFAQNKMQAITLPSSLESLGTAAFEYCTKLNGLTVPANCIFLGTSSINECHNLRYVNVLGDITNYGSWVFYGSGTSTRDGLKVYVNTQELKDAWDGERGSNFISDSAEIIVKDGTENIYFDNGMKSIWNWANEYVVDAEGYSTSELLNYCINNGITDIYQSFTQEQLRNQQDTVANFIKTFRDNGIEVWYMTGCAGWCIEPMDCLEQLYGVEVYNWGRDELSRINGVVLDNEYHVLPDTDGINIDDPEILKKYEESSKMIYTFCRKDDLLLYQTFGISLYEEHNVEKVYEYCDGIVLMNYFRATNRETSNGEIHGEWVANMEPEFNFAKAHGKPIVSIFEFTEAEESTHYQWSNKADADEAFKELTNYYSSDLVQISYHCYGVVD